MSDHGTWSDQPQPWTEEEGPGESHARVILLASVAALGGFLFGYDTAVINGAVSAIDAEYDASSATLGLTVSSALVGSALGALMAGRIADRWGRLHAVRTLLGAAGVLAFLLGLGQR